MSLIAWWPLSDSTLNNFVDPSNPLQSGLAYNAARGKISAYSFYNPAQLNSGGLKSTKEVNLGPTQSMFCWVYLTEYSWLSGVITNHNHDSPTGMGLTMNAAGNICVNTSSIVSCDGCSEANHGFRTYYVYRSEGIVPKNQWCHIGYTFNNGVLSFYINGVQQKVVFNDTNTNQYEYTNVHLKYMRFGKATINVFGWSTAFSEYGLKGNLCDARVYDHALSKKEVQELSRALVLHYTFDNSSFENTTNLLSGSVTNFSNSPLGTYSGFSNQMGTGSLIEVREFQNKRCLYVRGGSGSNDRCYISKDVTGSTKYTFSCDIYSTSQITLRAEGNGGGYGSGWPEVGRVVYSTPGRWQRISYTMNVAASPRLYLFFIVPNGVECYINNLQLEEKDHDTPYTPTTRVGIIGDSGGLGNSGQLVLPEYYSFTQDSILGTGALYSAGDDYGNAYIKTNLNPSFIAGTGTICFWYKKNTGSAGFLVATPDPGNQTHYLWANSPGESPWNGGGASYSHWYIDGVQGKTPVSDTDWHFYCIAGVNISGWTSFAIQRHGDGSWLYRGKIADFRIYNTVLSTTDIEALYNVRWSANKQGQVFSNAINEGQEKFQIVKAGVNNCNQVYESGVVPSGYLALDGIKMERVPWINTGVVFNNAHTQIMVAADVTPTATSGNNCLAGCGNSDWTGPVMLNFCGGKLEFGTNGYSTSSEAQGAYTANERLVVHAIIDYSSQKWFKNGVQIKNITSRTCPTTTAPLYIGTFKTPSSSVGNDNSFRGFIHFFEVKYGSIHKKFIPCKRLSDSVLGMYEINEGVFYSPEGGTYTAGRSTASLGRDGSLYCAEINEI